MPIPPKDIVAIAELKGGRIDRYCQRIYARLRRLFEQGSTDEKLTYEALWGTLLRGLVRTIPVALEYRDLCSAMASRLPVEEFRRAMNQLPKAAEELALETGVILSFDETRRLQIVLEHWHWELPLKRLRSRVVFSMEDADVKAGGLRQALSETLLAKGYDAERARVGSYALARLASACELFVEKMDELLTSRTRPQIYTAASSVFALTIELYARGYELEHVFNTLRLEEP